MLEIQRLLVPVDFSGFSDGAVKFAAAMAANFNAEMIIFHAISEDEVEKIAESRVPRYPIDMIYADMETELATHVGKLVAPSELEGLRVRYAVSSGTAAREIVEAAKLHKVDLIVMATHGRTGLSHVLMGSIAEQVMRLAECPVVTMKSPRA